MSPIRQISASEYSLVIRWADEVLTAFRQAQADLPKDVRDALSVQHVAWALSLLLSVKYLQEAGSFASFDEDMIHQSVLEPIEGSIPQGLVGGWVERAGLENQGVAELLRTLRQLTPDQRRAFTSMLGSTNFRSLGYALVSRFPRPASLERLDREMDLFHRHFDASRPEHSARENLVAAALRVRVALEEAALLSGTSTQPQLSTWLWGGSVLLGSWALRLYSAGADLDRPLGLVLRNVLGDLAPRLQAAWVQLDRAWHILGDFVRSTYYARSLQDLKEAASALASWVHAAGGVLELVQAPIEKQPGFRSLLEELAVRFPLLPPVANQPASNPTAPVETLLKFEQEHPEQFSYNRGFDGKPLGTVPTPLDPFWRMGQEDRTAGRPRRDLILDIEAGARMLASENPEGTERLHTEQLYTQLRQLKPGQSLHHRLTGGQGFGPQGGRRPVSTAKEATPRLRECVSRVLSGQLVSGLQGARKWFEPAQQDLVYAAAEAARRKQSEGKPLTPKEERLLRYERDAAGIRRSWAERGGARVGEVEGNEFWT